jgi:hypothetical protein
MDKKVQLITTENDDNSISTNTKDKRDVKLNETRKTKTSLVECNFTISDTLEKVLEFIDWEFDYEIGEVKLEENQVKVLKTAQRAVKYESLILNKLDDTINIEINNGLISKKGEYIKKSNCLKRMVSLKKRRFENKFFDLDLAYITKRVIAMGYPSSGCESIFRNSLSDVREFIKHYHNNGGAKIYNLCIEKERVYPKSNFNNNKMNSLENFNSSDSCDLNCKVGFFPFKDHNPPPIKLILEFCVDISIYLSKSKDSVAMIHCKAGKGRTGLMIVCYLIFSELLPNSDQALKHFAYMRTYNNKGITIPSQIRYVKYFEMYLILNYKKPYVKMIPRIIKTQFSNSLNSNNMIGNFLRDKSYFLSPNLFRIKEIKIGPFKDKTKLGLKIFDNELQNFKFSYDSLLEEEKNDKGHSLYYLNVSITTMLSIQTDAKFDFSGIFKFYFWLNLWFSTVDYLYLTIKNFENDDNEKSLSLGSLKSFNSNVNLNIQDKENFKSKESQDLFDYLESFNTNSDLNKFIDLVNSCLDKNQQKSINKEHLKIVLDKTQLDKFAQSKSVLPEFKVILTYELLKGVK